MNYMIAILPKMAGFLLLVLIGFTASRIGVIKKEAMPSISGFLLKIVLPALTISLIWENQTTFYTMTRYGRRYVCLFRISQKKIIIHVHNDQLYAVRKVAKICY